MGRCAVPRAGDLRRWRSQIIPAVHAAPSSDTRRLGCAFGQAPRSSTGFLIHCANSTAGICLVSFEDALVWRISPRWWGRESSGLGFSRGWHCRGCAGAVTAMCLRIWRRDGDTVGLGLLPSPETLVCGRCNSVSFFLLFLAGTTVVPLV